MTAAIGHPALRLIRVSIGRFELGKIPPGIGSNSTKTSGIACSLEMGNAAGAARK